MDAHAQPQREPAPAARASRILYGAPVLIGLTSVIAQIVLMRELMVVFSGNEVSLGVMLANWLLWTAFGSGFLGRWSAHVRRPGRLVAILQAALAAALPLTILAVRAGRQLFASVPGEILGPVPMFLTSLAALSLFCAVSGWLFVAASRLYLEKGAPAAQATGAVYLLEAAGSGAGGILASLILIRFLSPFEIASLLALANLASAASLWFGSPFRRRAAVAALVPAFAFFVFPFGSRRLEDVSFAQLWRGLRVVAVRNSIYGNLAVVETDGTRSVYENGLAVFTMPDPSAAEEAVHFALLQHPSPRSLLLIGGGVNGSLAEALSHPNLERADYVELDPAILDVARQHLPRNSIPADPRVRVHHADGRLFLKLTGARFDVIVVNLPEPQTAQLNRFYTLEFFQEAARKLSPGGVFSFQLRASENYISPELADFLRCIYKTLRQAFPEVSAMPGHTVHFFASTQPGVLGRDAANIVARLRSRGLRTTYVREYFIPFRMMPDRVLDLESQIRPRPETPVNRDFAPIAYYFDTALWSAQFHDTAGRLFRAAARAGFMELAGAAALLFFAPAAAVVLMRRKETRLRATAGFCVAAMGFTLIGLEILLLLAFQAIYGYVYHQLAILVAGFMAGMALGSRSGLRGTAGLTALARLQVLAALSPVLLCGIFALLARFATGAGLGVASHILFPGLAVLCGVLGGYQFPVASRVFFAGTARAGSSPGALYGLDLAGAWLGAIALSAYLVPVFGFLRTACLMMIVNLAPALAAAIVSRPRLSS